MYRESFVIPCSIIRGGTSKGVFFLENAVHPEGELRDKVLLSALGSPDIRQIDGLGGANSLTSKVCIIGPSNREDADVDYTYGQVYSNILILGQPYGPMEVTIEMEDGIIIKEGIFRTSRKILDGNVYIPFSKVNQ